MADPKRHLVPRPTATKAACGLMFPRLWTVDPARVTCIPCTKDPLTADAEIRQQHSPRVQ